MSAPSDSHHSERFRSRSLNRDQRSNLRETHEFGNAPSTRLREFIQAICEINTDRNTPSDPSASAIEKIIERLTGFFILTIHDYVSFGLRNDETGDNWGKTIEMFIESRRWEWHTPREEATHYFWLGKIHSALSYFRMQRNRAIIQEFTAEANAENTFHD